MSPCLASRINHVNDLIKPCSAPSGGLFKSRSPPRKLAAEFDRIVHEPDTQKQFAELGGEPVGGSPATFASFIHQEILRWIRVSKEAGIHIE